MVRRESVTVYVFDDDVERAPNKTSVDVRLAHPRAADGLTHLHLLSGANRNHVRKAPLLRADGF